MEDTLLSVAKAVPELQKCFNTILHNEELNLDHLICETVITKELGLQIPISQRFDLKVILVKSLALYMQIWPGWLQVSKHNKNNFKPEAWLVSLKKYLIYKLNNVIKMETKMLNEQVQKSAEIHKEVSTQTDAKENKTYVTKKLTINGTASFINNLCFHSDLDGCVKVTAEEGKQWQYCSYASFINRPYLEATVQLPNVMFVRSVKPAFERYLSLGGEENPGIKPTSYEHKEKLNHNNSSVLTHNYLATYLAGFYNMTKEHKEFKKRIGELDLLFREFLRDIREDYISKATIATGVKIVYNIGKKQYLRITPKTDSSVSCQEIMIPLIENSLLFFTDEIDEKETSFRNLSILRKNPQDVKKILASNCVTYKCTLCNIQFQGATSFDDVKHHFCTEHKNRHTFKCIDCQKDFDSEYLASNRWNHGCLF